MIKNQVIFISGNDTDIGKTRITATLARQWAEAGDSVLVLKVVQCGIHPGEPDDVDAVRSLLPPKATWLDNIQYKTLFSFREGLAPVESARLEGVTLKFETLVQTTLEQPSVNKLLIEGSGGLTVPLEEGPSPRDWADFAVAIRAQATVLVIENRLGAINQARLLANYAQRHALKAGWWLNQVQADVPANVLSCNKKTLSGLNFPLWGVQGHGEVLARETINFLRETSES